MNKQEAMEILNSEIMRFRSMEYEELTGLINSSMNYEREAPSGAAYQIEIQAFWDNHRESNGNIRVIALIDDGRFPYCFSPLSSDFIKSPEGNFVGE